MRWFLSVLLFCQLGALPLAQASEVRAYVRRESIWSNGTIVVDGHAHERHFFTGFSGLPDAMRSNSQAEQFAERAKTQAMWGSILVWGGLAGALTYGLASVNSNYDPNVYWTIFLVPFVPGVLFEAASEVNVNKAINAYNGINESLSFHVTPIRDGGLASLGWTF